MSQRSAEELERLLSEAEKVRGNSLWKDAMRRFKKNFAAKLSLWFLILLSLISILTPMLPLAPPARVRLSEQFQPPKLELIREGWSKTEYHDLGWFSSIMVDARASVFGDKEIGPIMGTDSKGRCLLSRILWGGRVSLLVGLVATLVSLLVGVSYGALSGYFGGWIDNLMMRIVDVLYSIPFIFLVIFLITVLRENQDMLEKRFGLDRMMLFFGVIGLVYWLTMARVVRGQVLSLKHKEFVEAAQVMGASTRRILRQHLVPNVLSIVIVYLTLTIPRVMLFEAFLSFLGLGVQPPDVSWGILAANGIDAINPIHVYWWFVLFPGLALGFTLVALNFLGDGLRDALDPKLKDR
jgi:oligopeptide transport system permease protein